MNREKCFFAVFSIFRQEKSGKTLDMGELKNVTKKLLTASKCYTIIQKT